jgi:hypothetical protein
MHKLIMFISMLIMLVVTFMLESCRNIFNLNVKTTKIFHEDIKKVSLSPDRKRLLIINDRDEIVLFDVEKEEIIARYPMVTEDYAVYEHGVDWEDSNKIGLVKHYPVLGNEDKVARYYVTEDFKRFELLFQYDKRIKYRTGPGMIMFVQDTENKRISIKYSDNEVWDTGWSFDYTGYSWSSDGRYLLLARGKSREMYLLDTSKRTISKLDNYFAGKWAPTKNLYCFYTSLEAKGFQEKGIYVFNAEDLSFFKLNSNMEPSYKSLPNTWGPTFVWSPDSRYIAIPDVGEMFLFDTASPEQKPKILVDFDGQIDRNRVAWSKDLKHVLFSYDTASINVFKLYNYYVARVNIDTRKMKKRYIDGLLHKEFFWIDDNTIIYRVEYENGLYKSKIRW